MLVNTVRSTPEYPSIKARRSHRLCTRSQATDKYPRRVAGVAAGSSSYFLNEHAYCVLYSGTKYW